MRNREEKINHRRWQIEQSRKNKVYKAYQHKQYTTNNGEKHEVIKMPPVLDLYGGKQIIKDTLDIIHRLEKHNQSDCCTITLDLGYTIEIKAAALVVLFSTLDRLIIDGRKTIRIRFDRTKLYSNHEGFNPHYRVKKILEKAGICDLCNTGTINNTFDQKHLPIVSSSGGRYRDEIVDFIVKKIYKEMSPSLENIYADAIQEAINNVAAHAYLNQVDVTKKWWLLCDVIGDQLYLVIYDSGIGIPKSFEVTADFSQINWDDDSTVEQFQNLYNECLWMHDSFPTFDSYIQTIKNQAGNIHSPDLPDAHKIFMAMHGNMTRKTGKDEIKHGQGSKSIKALVSNNDKGILWIYSGLGRMKFSEDSSTPVLDNLPRNLTGTLIQWNIKVSS